MADCRIKSPSILRNAFGIEILIISLPESLNFEAQHALDICLHFSRAAVNLRKAFKLLKLGTFV